MHAMAQELCYYLAQANKTFIVIWLKKTRISFLAQVPSISLP